jgi:hypothetical protein
MQINNLAWFFVSREDEWIGKKSCCAKCYKIDINNILTKSFHLKADATDNIVAAADKVKIRQPALQILGMNSMRDIII